MTAVKTDIKECGCLSVIFIIHMTAKWVVQKLSDVWSFIDL